MASILIYSPIIGTNLTQPQELMSNQTDPQWMLVYDKVSTNQNGDRDQAATIFLIVVYLSFLLTAIILAIFTTKRVRTREREQQKNVKRITFDRPPSYKTLFFDEDPPKYHELNFV